MKPLRMKGEAGLTLIEMLVVLALIGLIMGSATAAIYAIIKSSSISNEQNVALRQVQNAGYWITRDVLQADDEPTLDPGITGFPISMQYYKWGGGTNFTPCTVDYSIIGDKLERQVNCGTPETILIADYLIVADTAIVKNVDNTYTLTVKAAFGDAEVTRTYEIERRLE